MQLLQEVSSIKGRVKKNKFSKFVLYAGENETAFKGSSCVNGEERTDMPNCPDEVIA